jgi:hypothetical protein
MEFDYAWGWFQHHASQRLTAFNFFLVIVGLLLVGYAQAIDHTWTAFGVGIGILGALVAAGFLALDVRNFELVIRGRDALEELELGMTIRLSRCEENREKLGEALGQGPMSRWLAAGKARRKTFTHRFWLRLIIATVGLGFAVGAVLAACGSWGVVRPGTISCRTSTVLVLHRPGFDLNLVQRSEREGEQRSGNDDGGRPDHGLGGDLHVQSIGMGNYKRVQTGRHCGKEPVGGG